VQQTYRKKRKKDKELERGIISKKRDDGKEELVTVEKTEKE
jgi:hypothetical protein